MYHKIYKNLTFCGKIASTINANKDKQHHTQLCWVTDIGDIIFRNQECVFEKMLTFIDANVFTKCFLLLSMKF